MLTTKHLLSASAVALLGAFLILLGTMGLGLVVGELIWPNANPVRIWQHRIMDMMPNLLSMLALPGGVILFLRGMRMLHQWRLSSQIPGHGREIEPIGAKKE